MTSYSTNIIHIRIPFPSSHGVFGDSVKYISIFYYDYRDVYETFKLAL